MKKKHQLLVTNMELPAVFRVQNRKETTPYIPEAHAIGGTLQYRAPRMRLFLEQTPRNHV